MMKTSPLKDSPRFPRPRGYRKPSDQGAPPGESPVTHGYFKGFDGTKLFYSIEGRGRPLVFCYGLVCSSLHWTYQIDHFRHTHQAVWFDYRGHQNSEIPADPTNLTLEAIALDMERLFDELGLKDAVLLGHSMGVNVVLEFYRRNPDRVAGMILANGTAQRPLETLFNNNTFQSGFRLLRRAYDLSPRAVNAMWKFGKNNPATRSLVALAGFNPHLTPKEDIALYVDQVADMDPEVFIRLIENYDRADAASWLHGVRTPTLIIAGEKDRVVPLAQQELLHQLIPGSQFAVIRHGSHCAQMDLPDLVNSRIEKFLREIDYGEAKTQ